MIPKTEIYFASRKTSSAHVYITKGVGKIRKDSSKYTTMAELSRYIGGTNF